MADDGGAERTRDFREVVRGLGTGVALADPDSWLVTYENERFFDWFAPNPESDRDTLEERLDGLDDERARSRLEQGRDHRFEVEVGSGARKRTIEVTLRNGGGEEPDAVLVEAIDVSKRKEAEYMLDSYARMAEKNTREVQREKERAEKLLLNIMPRAVYEEMKDFGSVAPARFESATILMLDFVGFTEMAVSREPGTLISELNDIFSAFDRIVELFGCERMKTIGDAYMAVAGIPEETDDHAQSIARVALRMRRYLERRNTSHREPWLARIGINSGAVVGSIVGVQKYVYDIFGPGVNLAARMESISEPMQITVSGPTYELIKQNFICGELGEVEVKGFGSQPLYSLDGEVPSGR
jgi:adenylate cyclase